MPQVHNSKVDELGLAAEGGPAEAVPQTRGTHWHAVLDRAAARPADMLPSDDRVRPRFQTLLFYLPERFLSSVVMKRMASRPADTLPSDDQVRPRFNTYV